MKNKQCEGFSLWEFLGGLALLLIGALMIYPMFAPARESVRPNGCPQNLKQIGLAMLQYQHDFNEHLPPIALSPTSTALNSSVPFGRQKFYEWADALYPYAKSVQIFQCLSEATRVGNAPTKSDYTDYWFNSQAAGQKFINTPKPAQTIAFGDGNDGKDLTDARYNLNKLPAAWIQDQNSPAYRHKGMANYAFLDGHVKALSPDQITNEPVAKGKATFEVK